MCTLHANLWTEAEPICSPAIPFYLGESGAAIRQNETNSLTRWYLVYDTLVFCGPEDAPESISYYLHPPLMARDPMKWTQQR
ncbi:hypothetical protein CY34DRAFT_813174 [Suillus luteus UH-Slu-Lm8-n1]|uniref:Uncharacterized protein n=1 Tax=Suillus luteus UH-Slu-Lm8-n1 TaxID=930992 RepID=A0A0D0AQ27_9AGAM|nr:hypothetical protein CY34DRAFT_813174 [Suillus luteus UH-Slu-Lm8-n1]